MRAINWPTPPTCWRTSSRQDRGWAREHREYAIADIAFGMVLPFVAGGRLRGVLDLDSPLPGGFCEGEARLLEGLLARVGPQIDW